MSGDAALAALDFAVIGAYLLGMLTIGALVARRIRGFEDYFVAGHRMTAPLLVCTLVSTYYGLDVLFGGSEVSYQEGVVAWFAYTRPYYIAILIAALAVAPRLRRYPFLSLPDALGHFYGNGTRAVGAIASFFYSLPFMAIMGIGVLLDVVLDIPYPVGVMAGAGVALVYTLMGGLLADALTDTVQFVLMCVTLGIAAALTLEGMGGVEEMRTSLPPSFFEPTGTYPPAVLIVFAGSALSVLVEPAFYQRIFAADRYRSVLVALLVGVVLWAAFDWIVTIMGMAAAASGLETDPTYALLTITLDVLPMGLKGAFVAGVLATAMSTIDSYLLISGGNLSYDLYRPLRRPDLSDRALLRLTRWCTAVAAVACVMMALFFQSIVSAWIFMSTLLTATVLVPLLAALYLKRPPRPAAGLAAGLSGMTTAVLFFAAVGVFGDFDPEWETVIWRLEMGGRSVALWQEYALLIALPVSLLAFVLGQRVGRRPSPVKPAAPAAAALERVA
ncbi:MAG TPA: sodium:solute symporter family protein [Longimicrobiaceae bacterium]